MKLPVACFVFWPPHVSPKERLVVALADSRRVMAKCLRCAIVPARRVVVSIARGQGIFCGSSRGDGGVITYRPTQLDYITIVLV